MLILCYKFVLQSQNVEQNYSTNLCYKILCYKFVLQKTASKTVKLLCQKLSFVLQICATFFLTHFCSVSLCNNKKNKWILQFYGGFRPCYM